MAEFNELDFRIRALEARVAAVGIGAFNPAAEGATQCGTGVCTSCKVDDALGILLPGVDRPYSGREIAAALNRLKELEG